MAKRSDVAKELSQLSPYEIYPFATFIPGRTNGDWSSGDDYKRHATLGHAKSAVAHTTKGAIYKWENNQWVAIFYVDKSGLIGVGEIS